MVVAILSFLDKAAIKNAFVKRQMRWEYKSSNERLFYVFYFLIVLYIFGSPYVDVFFAGIEEPSEF